MTKLTDAEKAGFTAWIPTEFAHIVIDGEPPETGEALEMVCVHADPNDGYGLKFKRKEVDRGPHIWMPH